MTKIMLSQEEGEWIYKSARRDDFFTFLYRQFRDKRIISAQIYERFKREVMFTDRFIPMEKGSRIETIASIVSHKGCGEAIEYEMQTYDLVRVALITIEDQRLSAKLPSFKISNFGLAIGSVWEVAGEIKWSHPAIAWTGIKMTGVKLPRVDWHPDQIFPEDLIAF